MTYQICTTIRCNYVFFSKKTNDYSKDGGFYYKVDIKFINDGFHRKLLLKL